MNSNARRKVRRKMARLEKEGVLTLETKKQVEELLIAGKTVDVLETGEIVTRERKSSGTPKVKKEKTVKVADLKKLKAQVLRLKEIIAIRTKQRESGRKNAQDARHIEKTEGYKKLLAKKEAKLEALEQSGA